MSDAHDEISRHIAGRVWCDPQMQHCVMDAEAANKIAEIVKGVLAANYVPVEVLGIELVDTYTRYGFESNYQVTFKVADKYLSVLLPYDPSRHFDTQGEARRRRTRAD